MCNIIGMGERATKIKENIDDEAQEGKDSNTESYRK